jgi:hypothetical protein
MLFNILFVADWNKIVEQRQSLINHGNQRKNAKHIDYDYKIGDKVLLINEGVLCKQSPHMAKSHGLSLQFIQMELSGFNAEPEQNNLVSGEYNHLQMIFYKLGKIYTSIP